MAKKKIAQYKYPFITLQQAVMTQQLEAHGRERKGGWAATELQTHQPSLGGTRGSYPLPPALVIIKLGTEQTTGDRGPQGTGGHSAVWLWTSRVPSPSLRAGCVEGRQFSRAVVTIKIMHKHQALHPASGTQPLTSLCRRRLHKIID